MARDDVDPYEQENTAPTPPKISSMRKYRRTIAEHVGKKIKLILNGYKISFWVCARYIAMSFYL